MQGGEEPEAKARAPSEPGDEKCQAQAWATGSGEGCLGRPPRPHAVGRAGPRGHTAATPAPAKQSFPPAVHRPTQVPRSERQFPKQGPSGRNPHHLPDA